VVPCGWSSTQWWRGHQRGLITHENLSLFDEDQRGAHIRLRSAEGRTSASTYGSFLPRPGAPALLPGSTLATGGRITSAQRRRAKYPSTMKRPPTTQPKRPVSVASWDAASGNPVLRKMRCTPAHSKSLLIAKGPFRSKTSLRLDPRPSECTVDGYYFGELTTSKR